MNDYKEILKKAFSDNGISHLLSKEGIEKLAIYANHLTEKSKVMNLTAITDPEGIAYKHFADCATVSSLITPNASIIDIGCGAGFPSVVLAILRPDLSITALDSTSKKIDFIKESCELAKIDNLTAVSARAEDYIVENREKFDFCISRAVSALNILSEISLPYTKMGGYLLAMKGSKAEFEICEAQKAICTLGGSLERTVSFDLVTPNENCERNVVVIKKINHTPTKYPRKYAQILKKPL